MAGNVESILLQGAHQHSISPEDVDLIVVTDSEEILGIGDQGVGGIGISIAKLILYTAISGIHPGRVLPIVLDVGTNNQELLDDRLYIGWRAKRVPRKEYDAFVDEFVQGVKKSFKNAYLHWEDFGIVNARRILTKYQGEMCTFNDDIQGSGAITLAAVMAALKLKNEKLSSQRIVIFGAGTAGIGIADQIRTAMEKEEGLSKEEARRRFWCVDKIGLITSDIPSEKLSIGQERYTRPKEETSGWKRLDDAGGDAYTLLDVVENIHPTILIGTSTCPQAFNERIIRVMASKVEWPIIFPLSNPTRLAEAKPKDILRWTDGKAFVAAGSPFPPVELQNSSSPTTTTTIEISECNNSFIYPGIGLGCIVAGAFRCSEEMIWEGIKALVEHSPAFKEGGDRGAGLLPPIKDSKKVSYAVACAVAREALRTANTRRSFPPGVDIERIVEEEMWKPCYADIIPQRPD